MNMNGATMDICIHKYKMQVVFPQEWNGWVARDTRVQLDEMSPSFPQGLFQSAFLQQHTQHMCWLIACQRLALTDWVSVADTVHVSGSSLRLSFEDEQFLYAY